MSSVSYLFIDLNSYFAAVEQELSPSLRSKPIAVIPGNTRHTCCIAVSYEAKAYGVKTGTMIREAKKLCPNISFRVANHKNYVDYHHRIMSAIESIHPIHQILSIDECVLHLRGRDSQLKNAIKLAHEIRGSIFEVGSQLKCSIGLSSNRFLAKVASDMQKPNGLSSLLKEELPHKLYSLKLRDFPGIGLQMEKRLRLHGIHTSKELLSKDMHFLRQVWGGVYGERFYKLLRGIEVQDPFKSKTKSIGHSHVLEPQFRSERGNYQMALRLLQKAAMRLRALPAWTKGLSLSLRYLDNSRWASDIQVHETNDTISLIRHLEVLWKRKPKGIAKKVSLTFFNLVHPEEKNFSLLDHPKQEKLSEAMDKINYKYGKNVLYIAESQEAQEVAQNRIAFDRIPDFELDENN